MAIAYARTQVIGRSAGRSALACAAYRAGERLEDERQGKTQDYRARSGVLASDIMTPANAPVWMNNREILWNAVERREDRSTRPDEAQLAREIVIALPHELDDQHREYLVRNIGKEATRKGMVFDYAIHAPDREGDNRNYHAHVMLTMREIDRADPDGFGNKAREWNTKTELEAFKGIIERETNRMLERQGIREQVQFKWEDREAQKHMGHAATELERQGVETEVGNENRAIRQRNHDRAEAHALYGELKHLQAELDREEAQQPSAAERADESVARFQARQQQESPARAPEPSATRQLEKVADGMERGAGAALRGATRAADTLGDVADRFMSAAADFLVGATPPRRITEAEWRTSKAARDESARQRKAQVQHRDTLARMLAEREANRPIDPEQVRYLDYAAKQEIRDRGEPALNEMLDALAREERQRLRERSMGLERER